MAGTEIPEDGLSSTDVGSHVPLEINEKIVPTVDTHGAISEERSPIEEKLAESENNSDLVASTAEIKTNFGFLPIPKNCRISPTKPFNFNLGINILFGFACTFTVPSIL
jgi:hypothetical protein